jgi:hypothetical protein
MGQPLLIIYELLSRVCCDHGCCQEDVAIMLLHLRMRSTPSYELRIITQRIDSRAAQHVLRKIKRGTWIIFHLVHVLQALGKASHAIDLFTRCWNRLISITDSVERDEDGSGKDSLCLSRKIFQLSFLNTVELNATEQAKRLSLPSDKLCNERYLCGDPHSHRYSAWNCVSIVSLRCDKHVGISHYVHGKSNKSNFGGRIMRMFIGKHVGQSLAMF